MTYLIKSTPFTNGRYAKKGATDNGTNVRPARINCNICKKDCTCYKIIDIPAIIKPTPNILINVNIRMGAMAKTSLFNHWPAVNIEMYNNTTTIKRLILVVATNLAVIIRQSPIGDIDNCSNVPRIDSFVTCQPISCITTIDKKQTI